MKRVAANIVEMEDGREIVNGVVEMDDSGNVVSVFSLDDMQWETHSTVFVTGKLKIKNNKIWQRN